MFTNFYVLLPLCSIIFWIYVKWAMNHKKAIVLYCVTTARKDQKTKHCMFSVENIVALTLPSNTGHVTLPLHPYHTGSYLARKWEREGCFFADSPPSLPPPPSPPPGQTSLRRGRVIWLGYPFSLPQQDLDRMYSSPSPSQTRPEQDIPCRPLPHTPQQDLDRTQPTSHPSLPSP